MTHRTGASPDARIIAALKAHHGVRLKAQGMTYDAVARSCWTCITEGTVAWPLPHPAECPHDYRAMYHDRSAARKAVSRALAEEYGRSSATREELRRAQLASIDAMKRAAMPRALGGDMEAARVAVKLLEREAKLYGLDAPTRVTVTTEMDQQIAELMEQLGEEQTLTREQQQ